MAVIALEDVAKLALAGLPDTVRSAWVTQQTTLARRVAALQAYADGDHPADMTKAMREALRLRDDGLFNEFCDNYMDLIIQTPVDRCRVTGFDTAVAADQDWIDALLMESRFDGLQMDLFEGAFRDGDSYLMAYFDNDRRRALFSHEPAFDGTSGMLVYYDSTVAKAPQLAAKIWPVGADVRVNLYFVDRVERYVKHEDSALVPYVTDAQEAVSRWTLATGEPIGVPVIPVRNRTRGRNPYGRSEIETAIPLQNALNRTLYSMVMSAELSAFMIRFAKGFEPPTSVTPGSWIKAGNTDGQGRIVAPATAAEASALGAVEVGALAQAELVPYLDMARWLKSEISFVTRTPAPEFMGSDAASGEALKQREIGLLGKVQRFQVKAGNALEDAVRMAARVEAAFGTGRVPTLDGLACRWAEAAIRNDAEVIDNAVKLADRVSQREFLRMVGQVYDWDEAKIDTILIERGEDTRRNVEAAGAFLPQFNITQAEVAA